MNNGKDRKDTFFGDDDEIYDKYKLNMMSFVSRRTKETFDYNQEKSELNNYCNQIFESCTIIEEKAQIILDSDSLEEIVNHLFQANEKIIKFNINNMIELNMQKFITDVINKIIIQHYSIDFEALSNLMHLILIWTNGTKDQIDFLFDQSFLSNLFSVSRLFFLKNSQIVGYSFKSIKNLSIEKFFPNDAIPEIITELLLILNQFMEESQSSDFVITNVFLESIQNVFLCFHAIIKNYLNQEEIKNTKETEGLIIIIKQWIDFIQEKGEKLSFSYEKNSMSQIDEDQQSSIDNSEDLIDNDVMCDNISSALLCMNEIVGIINEAANYYFTCDFIRGNLFHLLRQNRYGNIDLKKKALYTLNSALTIVGSDKFTAWDFVDERIWKAVERIIQYENDCDLKLILCKVINSILYKLPSVNQKTAKLEEEQDQSKEDENCDGDDKTENFEGRGSKEFNEEEEEEEEGIDEDNPPNEIIYFPRHDYVYDLFEYDVLSNILSLSGSCEEAIDVRIEATLAIARNIGLFDSTEICYLINANASKVFIDSLDFIDENNVEVIFNAILVFFKYIETLSRAEVAKYVSMIDKAYPDIAFNGVLENPVFEGKFDKIVLKSIEMLKKLRKMTPIEQREKSRENRERKEMVGDEFDFKSHNEYDEDDSN